MNASSKLKTNLIVLIAGLSIMVICMFFAFHNTFKEKEVQPKATYISTVSELMDMSMSGTYYLTEDVDLSGYNWTPLGTMENPFTGSLIGQKFNDDKIVTIKNLTITLTGEYDRRTNENVSYLSNAYVSRRYDGFFGIVKNATIKNIRFENVKYTFEYYKTECLDLNVISFGTICGRTYGNTTIENCEVRNLDVKIEHFNGGAGTVAFYMAGLIGWTADISNSEQANKYVYGKETTTLSATSGAITTIKNVIVSGDISLTRDGNGSLSNSAYFYFYGVVARQVYKETINVSNACFLPKNSNFHTKQGSGWVNDWTEGSDWFKIATKDASIENCCTNESEIVNLDVNFLDCSPYESTFFYDSTISYVGDGEYQSSFYNNNMCPVLTNSVESSVEHYIVVFDDYDGVESISFTNSSYFYEMVFGSYYRCAPCELAVQGLETNKLQLGDPNATIEITLKDNFETAGWLLNYSVDGVEYHYGIKIVPKDVNLKFELPINVSGITYNTTSSTIYTVAFTNKIQVSCARPNVYNYKISYIFTEKNGTVITVDYIIPIKYISTEFDVGKLHEISISTLLSSSGGLDVKIVPKLKLKTYNSMFTNKK